jgi:hypothetical protein
MGVSSSIHQFVNKLFYTNNNSNTVYRTDVHTDATLSDKEFESYGASDEKDEEEASSDYTSDDEETDEERILDYISDDYDNTEYEKYLYEKYHE